MKVLKLFITVSVLLASQMSFANSRKILYCDVLSEKNGGSLSMPRYFERGSRRMIGFDVSPSMTGETPADGPFYTALVDDRGEYICITVLEWKGKNDVYVSCGNKPENFSGDSIKRATFKFADMIPSLNSDAVVSCNYSRLSE